MRRFKKIIKYSLFLVLLTIIVVFASGYYFLKTTNGLKRDISLVNTYTNYTLTTGEVTGDLLSRTEIKQLHISGRGLEYDSESVVLDWKASSLWRGELIVRAITVDNAVVIITPNSLAPKPFP